MAAPPCLPAAIQPRLGYQSGERPANHHAALVHQPPRPRIVRRRALRGPSRALTHEEPGTGRAGWGELRVRCAGLRPAAQTRAAPFQPGDQAARAAAGTRNVRTAGFASGDLHARGLFD